MGARSNTIKLMIGTVYYPYFFKDPRVGKANSGE